jgi:glyoxylase-like metal-dependent hydrolase (beta-lactamase superfamily II)
MKRILLPLLLLPFLSQAQGWENVQIKSTNVAANVYYLEGRGGNIGVLIGADGVLLVDDQFAALSDKITAAVKELTPESIQYIVNTHYHGDHTGGNENFKNQAVEIIAHKKVKERLALTFTDKIRDRTMEAKPESFWPSVSLPFDNTTIEIYGEEVNLIYLPKCHTDGDLLVHFKKANVLHTGDAFVRYGFPFIDVAAGGSIDGFIKAQERILDIANESTKIIPGHGKIASTTEVKELLTMLQETRKIVSDAKKSEVLLEDLIPKNPLAAYHDRWNGSFITTDLFVQLVYESL